MVSSNPSNNSILNQYYKALWDSEDWSGPLPNYDEKLRLDNISWFISKFVYSGQTLKILDVGCGRGWLTHQLGRFGKARGMEVVPEAISKARTLFPDIEFILINPLSLSAEDIARYGHADLIVSSEVVEHIPNADKHAFLHGLAMLSKPGGYVIITTPRGECWKPWLAKGGKCQPVEEWITEPGLDKLGERAGLKLIGRRRIHLNNHEYHFTGSLLHGRFWPRILKLIPSLDRVIKHANGLYQVALFRISK